MNRVWLWLQSWFVQSVEIVGPPTSQKFSEIALQHWRDAGRIQ